jgi:hypothetical protein
VQTIQQRGLDSSEAKERETVVDTGKWLAEELGSPDYSKRSIAYPVRRV